MATSILSGLAKAGGVRQVVGGINDSWGNPGGGEILVSEAGIGAVIPWADRLWFNTYPAQNAEGYRLGLWSMGADLAPRLERMSAITSAARIVHNNRLFISHYVVNRLGEISDITSADPGWPAMRPAGYARLPGDNTYVWALSMAGEIWRITVTPGSHVATKVADNTGLSLGGQAHGKAIWGHPNGRHLVVALNGDDAGRLASFDTSTSTYTVLSTGNWPWIEVAGSYDGNGPGSLFYAVGHDRKSTLLWMFDPASAVGVTPTFRKFRLPLASRQQLDGWQHEWMRIRQVETERFLMDAYGGFYQLSISTSNKAFSTGFPLVEPVSNHTRTVTDFVSWGGYLVMGSNQNTPQLNNKYPNAGQPDSGLLLTVTDDLWSYGKPHGEGFWYDNEAVAAGAMSEPMLIRGYDARSLFVSSSAATDVEVWVYHQHRPFLLTTITMTVGGYERMDLPAADWVAIKPTGATTLTAGVVVGSV